RPGAGDAPRARPRGPPPRGSGRLTGRTERSSVYPTAPGPLTEAPLTRTAGSLPSAVQPIRVAPRLPVRAVPMGQGGAGAWKSRRDPLTDLEGRAGPAASAARRRAERRRPGSAR